MSEMKNDNNSQLTADIGALYAKLIAGEGSEINPEELAPLIERLSAMKAEAEARSSAADVSEASADGDEPSSVDLDMDWDSAFFDTPAPEDTEAVSAADGLVLSLDRYGRVDIEFISKITGLSVKDCIKELQGSIFQNPESWEGKLELGWETADEYLSGNLLLKKQIAERENEVYSGYFDENIKAIKAVLPPKATGSDIYVTLGSPWVPPEVIDDFIFSLFGKNKAYTTEKYKTTYDPITGTWHIPDKSRYDWGSTRTLALTTYGTVRISALHLIERTLNVKSVAVYDTKNVGKGADGKPKTKRIFNKAETLLATEKQKELIELFRNWVFTSRKRKDMLVSIFNEKFASVRVRRHNGEFLTLPTISKNISLYPYQKNAIARILFSKNTLLAHDVGAGKTYIMVAAGIELRRMGISKKNLYVVPNNLTTQWETAFLELLPTAKLLVISPSSFTPAKRPDMLRQMRDGDYDGIIIAYSCFEMIKLSKKYLLDACEEQKAKIDQLQKGGKKINSTLAHRQKKLAEEIKKLNELMADIGKADICFDELGVNTLFVDEAHNFKNVPIDTGVKILGVSTAGSDKCRDMMDKVHCVQRQNNGRGVVFATGTPITNSISDIYVMQKYLQSGMLELLDMQSFESWVGTFAEKQSEFEIDVDTQNYRLATRLSKFHNIPELTSLFAEVADFHKVDKADGLPHLEGYSDALISKTLNFADYLEQISARADMVRSGAVSRKDDNLLKIAGDGRRAALDMRLVDPSAPFTLTSKVYCCAERVCDIYRKSADILGTQLVFCDTSTPKSGFNMYDELKDILVNLGIPQEEIAYIHDAASERTRAKLFKSVEKGEVRVLIGSTLKLGLGVNVQERLIALHHLDVPWRPADMVQREGRIMRQGNTNPEIYIYRYITEGSFDSYIWQLLETKQRFINDILSGFVTERQAEDINEIVLGYAEIKALAVGNPLIKKRVECANELNKYMALHKRDVETKERLQRELEAIPSQLKAQEALIRKCQVDVEYAVANPDEALKEDKKDIREKLMQELTSHELEPEETLIMNYRGFDIVAPANLTMNKPYIWLVREGRYFLEISSSDIGTLLRIDNFIDNIPSHLEKLKDGARMLRGKRKNINAELARDFGYSDTIERLIRKLEKIDKELGVDKK